MENLGASAAPRLGEMRERSDSAETPRMWRFCELTVQASSLCSARRERRATESAAQKVHAPQPTYRARRDQLPPLGLGDLPAT
jgi:hypothetical protein